MAIIKVTTAQNIDIEYEIASLGDRIVARIIDLGIFVLIFILGYIVFGGILDLGNSDIAAIVAYCTYGALFVFYDLLCEIYMNGQSLGKKSMKIKVISADGNRPTVGQFLMRWIFRAVDFLVPGFAMAGGGVALITAVFTEKEQRIGDIVAGTVVIKTEQRTQIKHVAFMPTQGEYSPVFSEAANLTEKDVALIQDVVNTYYTTNNAYIVQNMALKIKKHLGIAQPPDMDDMQLLLTIIKDYSHLIAQAESL